MLLSQKILPEDFHHCCTISSPLQTTGRRFSFDFDFIREFAGMRSYSIAEILT